jgi:hypothetical protein
VLKLRPLTNWEVIETKSGQEYYATIYRVAIDASIEADEESVEGSAGWFSAG